VVVIMPARKGKIPRITFGAVQPVNLSAEEWQKIESAYGHSLSNEVRAQITVATNQFLQLALAESTTGSMSDALRRATRMRKCAQSLIAAIEHRSTGDVVRNYVDDELALSYARLNGEKLSKLLGIRSAPLAARKYVSEIDADLKRFVDACDLALREFNFASQYDYWPGGGAWEVWIRQLSNLLRAHDLPTGARKDSAKNLFKASPFVEFICEFQTHLPYSRAQHSKGALAIAINKARQESKPFVKPKSLRIRKSGRNRNPLKPNKIRGE
jgi:hypothetical protein